MYVVHVLRLCSKSSNTSMNRHFDNATPSDRFQCLDSRVSHLALLFAKRRSAHVSRTCRRRRHDNRRGIVDTSIGCVYNVEDATEKDATITRQGHRASPWSREAVWENYTLVSAPCTTACPGVTTCGTSIISTGKIWSAEWLPFKFNPARDDGKVDHKTCPGWLGPWLWCRRPPSI